MDYVTPSSSKGHSRPSTSTVAGPSSFNNQVTTITMDNRVRQSRKRSAPSSSSSSPASSVVLYNGGGDSSDDRSDNYSDFTCSICMENMNEPTITFCGHTYCRECILETIKSSARCPNCGSHLTQEKTFPNFALSDILTRSRNAKAIKAEILESTSTLPTGSATLPEEVAKLLTSDNYEHLNLTDLDRLLMVLQRRREIMASNDDEYQRKLLREFLTQLLKIKGAHMEQLQREIALINRDISAVGNGGNANCSSSSGSNASNNNSVPSASTSSSKDLAVQSCSSSSSATGIGFNTQPLELDQQSLSLSDRKKRMYRHFEELTQIYFDTRNVEIFDNRNYDDAIVPNEQNEVEDMEDGLDCFGRTLSRITQYHSLKPLATLAYSGDDMMSNSNIVSSIEFDKDNEFFAIAGVTKKIKLYEYINVIGSSINIHCPNAELICNAKISCLSWNNYFKNSLASSDYDGCVALWDASTCTKTRGFVEHEKRVWSVDWSAGNPRLLASGSDDSKVKLWSTNSERSIVTLDAKANVCSVKFCPESTHVIAFGSADHCIHYYDFRNTSEPLGVLYGHKKAVSYVKFAAKEELVSASTDSNLKLWDLKETFSCTRSFTGHVNEKNFVGLATDGNFIACGSENNSLYIYYKYLPKPLFSFKFENHRSMLEEPRSDESQEFVSAVAWKKGSPVVVAANSLGAIKILEMV